MRDRQLNVRLSAAEYRAARHWAFVAELSMSDLARKAIMEKIERLAGEQLEREQQLSWTRAES
jgi:hypothetical protein